MAMVDETVGEGSDPVGEGSLTTPPPFPEGRQCEKVLKGVRCTNRLPADAKPTRLYCDAHLARGSGSRPRVKPSGEETPPPSVAVNVKLPSVPKDKSLAAVQEGAEQFLKLLPLVLSMTGDTVCPPAMEQAIPAIAAQLAVLSKYHKGIATFFTPGKSTGEMVAWFGLMAATAPVVITVMVHHKMLPESTAAKLAAVMGMAAAAAEGDGSAS